MLVFYPIACTVVNYSNTFELNVVKHHLFTSWVSNAADIPSISCSCQIILRVSDHGQTLRDWVHRYNAAGLAGLSISNRKVPDQNSRRGNRPKLVELVEAGPNPRGP
jgi:hypothetical protein